MQSLIPTKRFAEIVYERTVERFLLRLFLRDAKLRAICIVSAFISTLAEVCFSLPHLRERVERVPTYVVTREANDDYQADAMRGLLGSPWIESNGRVGPYSRVAYHRQTHSRARFSQPNFAAARLFEAALRLEHLRTDSSKWAITP